MRVSMKPSARLWVCTTLSWGQAVTSWAFVNSRENTPPSRPMTSQVVAQIASFFNGVMVSSHHGN